MSTAWRVVRGTAGLLLFLVLLAGPPYLLLHYAHSPPISHHLPAGRSEFPGQANEGLLVLLPPAPYLLCWLTWSAFILDTLREAIWYAGRARQFAASPSAVLQAAAQRRSLAGLLVSPSLRVLKAATSACAQDADVNNSNTLDQPVEERPEDARTASTTPAKAQEQASDAPLVELGVLGPFEIRVAGQLLTTGLRSKAREALAFLATHAAGATADELTCALWPDAPCQTGRGSLHTNLANVRKQFRALAATPDNSHFLLRTNDRYRLNPTLISTDLARLIARLEAAEFARRVGDTTKERNAVAAAAACYRGPLLDGAPYDWIASERDALRRRLLDAITCAARSHKDGDDKLAFLERAITLDAFNEPLHVEVMTVQAKLGRHDAVIRTYRLLQQQLRELDAEPSKETRRALPVLLSCAHAGLDEQSSENGQSYPRSHRTSHHPSSRTSP
ncbi:BTAD domain-containing putative transcriptional regulator [Streptomyces sp. NPDC050315]|uniref:AfsR/SARP family transcriptional regulator n=1 Tax=Streptomyces sp. NPDC050315 TaxID=3155039 RepID=UPI00343558A1